MIEVDHHSSGVFGVCFLLMTPVPTRRLASASASVSCDVLPCEIVDLALRIAKPGQDIVSVCAELWGRRRGPWNAACQPKPRADHLDRAADARHLREGAQQLALEDLRMLENRRHVQHFAGRNAMLVQERGPLPGGLAGKRRLNLGIELEAVALAILPSGKTKIADEVLAPDQAAESLELLLFVGRDVEKAVAGAQRAGRARRHVLVAH